MKLVLVLVALGVLALIIGFVAGAGVLVLLSDFLLPPFNEAVDEDTERQFFPVAAAYLTWAVTTVVVFFVGWWKLPEDF